MKPLEQIIPHTDIVSTRFVDLIRRLLIFDPNQRMTVNEALNHNYFTLEVPMETYGSSGGR